MVDDLTMRRYARCEALLSITDTPPLLDDEEINSTSLILLNVYSIASNNMPRKIMDFFIGEFRNLYELVKTAMNGMMCRRGPGFKDTGMDIVSVLVHVLENGGTWHHNDKCFRKKTSLLEKRMRFTVEEIHNVLYKTLMNKYDVTFSMTYTVDKNRHFQQFPYAWYATDTRFQEPNFSAGTTLTEAKLHFIEKHKMYGKKVRRPCFLTVCA